MLDRHGMHSILTTLGFIARHPLSSKRPLWAFIRYTRWQIESRIRNDFEFNWIEGSKLIVKNGMTGATGNIYCGLHEFVDMAFLLHLLRPDDVFVDVGANVGSYSVLASAVCGARSISVEPDPSTMNALRRNIECNKIEDRVTLVEAAVGAEIGTARFTVGHDTTNRVASEGEPGTRVVQVRTLDECLKCLNPVLIKIDVEGYETEVIEGANATLLNPSLLAVQLETVDESVRTRLNAVGFRQSFYDPFARRLYTDVDDNLEIRSQNTLFIRNVDRIQLRVKKARRRNIIGHWI
jgi:FkbM family methyltransferase